ncbi:hypothetical protein ACCAA_130142 [Candidatus Accumulibacter aalborgensis]|uniref:Uncharacterized protein n=1 Tax=Candidatus Accumulibacter aalborgensis TaxID=1860102 RepID=A0A1A8XGA5_9PROT|nr:hypothetical protein ACCAA_130142 [Candidatus Accumulibacter aalborgensis]
MLPNRSSPTLWGVKGWQYGQMCAGAPTAWRFVAMLPMARGGKLVQRAFNRLNSPSGEKT